jgi:hypothetical protein
MIGERGGIICIPEPDLQTPKCHSGQLLQCSKAAQLPLSKLPLHRESQL